MLGESLAAMAVVTSNILEVFYKCNTIFCSHLIAQVVQHTTFSRGLPLLNIL